MEVLVALLFTIGILLLVALVLGLFALIGLELHWVIRAWSGHGRDSL
jgi:hypothetical protein